VSKLKTFEKKTHLDLIIDQNVNAKENHFKKAELITRASNSSVFYTNVAQNSTTKVSITSSVLYDNSRVAYKT
jgi:ribosomal protein S20